jgi:hypothetical protein
MIINTAVLSKEEFDVWKRGSVYLHFTGWRIHDYELLTYNEVCERCDWLDTTPHFDNEDDYLDWCSEVAQDRYKAGYYLYADEGDEDNPHEIEWIETVVGGFVVVTRVEGD